MGRHWKKMLNLNTDYALDNNTVINIKFPGLDDYRD